MIEPGPPPCRAAIELTLMMLPPPCRRMIGTTSVTNQITWLTLSLSTCSTKSSV
jgi:hypothetical protein